jgi:hypothetical protein
MIKERVRRDHRVFALVIMEVRLQGRYTLMLALTLITIFTSAHASVMKIPKTTS